MPNYRRSVLPGGTFFFTLVTAGRQRIFKIAEARECLRRAIVECGERWPFEAEAMVLLPDHMHMMWRMPEGDAGYSVRIAWMKRRFTELWMGLGGREQTVSAGEERQRRRGVWQPRFWEHTIRDEVDWEGHLHYIHYNPVKHGYVRCPHDWPYSTFGKWVEREVYRRDWGCCCEGEVAPPGFEGLRVEDME